MCALEGVCGSTLYGGLCIALFGIVVIAVAAWGVRKLTERRDSARSIEVDRTSMP